MAQMYILESASSGRYYVGATNDLARRLAEHKRGHSPYTRGRGPWKLVYREDFPDLARARQRERQVKSWKSHRSIEDLVAGRRLA